MKQIATLVYQWSRYDAERGLDHNAHFVQAAAGEPGVLIDPVDPPAPLARWSASPRCVARSPRCARS